MNVQELNNLKGIPGFGAMLPDAQEAARRAAAGEAQLQAMHATGGALAGWVTEQSLPQDDAIAGVRKVACEDTQPFPEEEEVDLAELQPLPAPARCLRARAQP